MNIKSILIHLDHSANCEIRLRTAIALTQQYEASLSGLFVIQPYAIPSYVEAQVSVDVINEITESTISRAKDRVASLQQILENSGVTMQSHIVEGPMIPVLREHSKYSDLLILGQHQPDDIDDVSHGLADALLFEGGCPCLIVPYGDGKTSAMKRILLTWNASRESAHAMHQALPLLANAAEVVVLSSEPDTYDTQMANGHPHAQHLENYLDAHSIPAIFSGTGYQDSASEAILNQAKDMDADLIVMGAYGHARLREIILGGVTRDLLKKSPVPLLLAH